jgi:hypothetical protein
LLLGGRPDILAIRDIGKHPDLLGGHGGLFGSLSEGFEVSLVGSLTIHS